jgi:hypothetical protein
MLCRVPVHSYIITSKNKSSSSDEAVEVKKIRFHNLTIAKSEWIYSYAGRKMSSSTNWITKFGGTQSRSGREVKHFNRCPESKTGLSSMPVRVDLKLQSFLTLRLHEGELSDSVSGFIIYFEGSPVPIGSKAS